MPCLNEADTIEVCVRKASETLSGLGLRGEVLVADNGSTDGSQRLATAAGGRVVPVAAKGYGSALMGGLEAARGRWVIMGDADDSYDFRELGKFVAKLREGHDLVQGCRLPWGGGTIRPGAMPFLHRWWGNPMFTVMARWMFGSPVHDIYCGLRGFRRDWQATLGQQCTGMEFATEMLIKASLSGARISEVPITLHPDGRKAHAPHLKTFRDGWRTLRFFLLSSPRWLFVVPGAMALLSGLIGYALALPGVSVAGARLDAHTLLFASVAIVTGWNALLMGVVAKTFAVREGLMPPNRQLQEARRMFTLERSLLLAGAGVAAGLALLLLAIGQWWRAGFGPLDYASTMRIVIPGATLLTLACTTFFGAFVVSIIELPRR